MISYQNDGKYSTADPRKAAEIVSEYSNALIDMRDDNARNSAESDTGPRCWLPWVADSRSACQGGIDGRGTVFDAPVLTRCYCCRFR
jgi:hypothetical protein